MKFRESYGVTKGVPAHEVEEPPGTPRRGAWSIELEESASHHLKPAVNRQPMFPRGGPEELAKDSYTDGNFSPYKQIPAHHMDLPLIVTEEHVADLNSPTAEYSQALQM